MTFGHLGNLDLLRPKPFCGKKEKTPKVKSSLGMDAQNMYAKFHRLSPKTGVDV